MELKSVNVSSLRAALELPGRGLMSRGAEITCIGLTHLPSSWLQSRTLGYFHPNC